MNYEPWFMENFREYFKDRKSLSKIILNYRDRPYHNLEHIYNMIQFIDKNYRCGNFLLISDIYYWSIIFAVIYHDVIYYPGAKYNEDLSADYFIDDYYNGNIVANNINPDLVVRFIMATKDHSSTDRFDQTIITADLAGLKFGDYNSLLSDEKKLFKEFQKYDVNEYRKGRIKFLNDFWENCKQNVRIPEYRDYIATKEYSLGVYCGSFNPMHIGHKNIIKKAEELFDKVIIARGINGQKQPSIKYNMPNLPHQVIEYSNIFKLLKDIEKNNCLCKIHLVRGLRNQYDMQAEEVFRKWVLSKIPYMRFTYLFCDSEYEHISSSSLRELESIEEDVSGYIIKDIYHA